MSDVTFDPVDTATHRRLAVDLFTAAGVRSSSFAGGDGFGDWDLASALEVTARAHLAAGEGTQGTRYAELAQQELETVADADDREVIAGQLAELDVRVGATPRRGRAGRRRARGASSDPGARSGGCARA